MSGFGEYAPNMVPTDALVVRDQAEPAHELVQYTGEDLARPKFGPSNPFRDDSSAASASQKRKNVLTGFAEETFVSEHTFRSKHRAVERRGGPEREFQSGAEVKAEAARIRKTREGKGSALVAEGDGEYKGPWASYKSRQAREIEVELEGGGEELASDEEYEIVEVEDDEDEDVVESGAVVQAPAEALARRQQVEDLGDETTTFHGSELHDYQGRTYMHVSLSRICVMVTHHIPSFTTDTRTPFDRYLKIWISTYGKSQGAQQITYPRKWCTNGSITQKPSPHSTSSPTRATSYYPAAQIRPSRYGTCTTNESCCGRTLDTANHYQTPHSTRMATSSYLLLSTA